MRLQLAIPENAFLSPVTFNRLLSLYGVTAIFLFALPLCLGLFYYVVPLQIGARGTALPRLGQSGLWLFFGGAFVIYAGYLFTPSEAGVNPLPPLSEVAFLANNGVDDWLAGTGMATLGFVLLSINLVTTMRNLRAPGNGLEANGGVLLGGGDRLLADGGDRPDDAGRDHDADDRPQLRRRLLQRRQRRGAAALAAPELDLLQRHYMLILIAALGAIAEIVPALSRRPLFSRNAVISSLVAIGVLGTLAWMQNMLTAPIGVGWMYFAMLMSLALIVPFGLVIFNLIATMVGGALRMRGPLRFAVGAISIASIGLGSRDPAIDGRRRLAAQEHHRRHRGDPLRPDRRCGLRRLRRAPLLVPEDDRPDDGREPLAALVLDDVHRRQRGLLPALPGRAATVRSIDAYKFFSGTGVSAENLIASIGAFILAAGILLTLVNALTSLRGGPERGARPLGRGDARVVRASRRLPPTTSTSLPDVRSDRPLRDIRDAIAHRDGAAPATEGEPQSVA